MTSNRKSPKYKPPKRADAAWLELFDKSEPSHTISLLENPAQLSKHLKRLTNLLQDYIAFCRVQLEPRTLPDGSWAYEGPEMIESILLLQFLERIQFNKITNLPSVVETLCGLYGDFLESGMPQSVGAAIAQSKRKKSKPSRPQLQIRALNCARENGARSAAEVWNWYRDHHETIDDEWGSFSIERAEGGYKIFDVSGVVNQGDFPNKSVTLKQIRRQVTRFPEKK